VSSSFDIQVSDMEITSIQSSASHDVDTTSSSRNAWGFAIRNGWAERTTTKKGLTGIRCLYPGCSQIYVTSSMTTSGINRHLRNTHKITEDSGINDGRLSRAGPLDLLFHSSKQPRVFDPTRFDDLLVRFIVGTKQPYAVVDSPELQDLLNHATMATISQVKLPSDDTMAKKVSSFRPTSKSQALF
jgi:hypothetical protein